MLKSSLPSNEGEENFARPVHFFKIAQKTQNFYKQIYFIAAKSMLIN